MQSVGPGVDFDYHTHPILSDSACSSFLLNTLNTFSASKTTKNLKYLGFELPPLILQKLVLLTAPPRPASLPPCPEEKFFSRFSGTNNTYPLYGGRQHIWALRWMWGGKGMTGVWPPIPAPPGRLSASECLSIWGSSHS